MGQTDRIGFWRAWWGTVATPRNTMQQLSAEGLNGRSWVTYGLFPLLYSASALLAYYRGATPAVWKPWVTIIPLQRYYLWEAVFLVPLSFQLWITFAAVAHLLARAQGGRGTCESTAAVFAYSYSVPLVLLLWLPDQIQSTVYGLEVRRALVAVYGGAAAVWMVGLSGIGLRAVHGLSMTRSVVTAAVAAALSYAPSGLLLIR